jgi:hypothetical protein
MKVRRQCPHVLLAKVGWKQGKALGSEAGSLLGSTLLAVGSRRRKKKISTTNESSVRTYQKTHVVTIVRTNRRNILNFL